MFEESTTEPPFPIGHNGGPPLVDDPAATVRQEIDDLYDEAKNWADGEPISSLEMHDAVSTLFDSLGDAGRRAEAMRVEEKKPHDDAAAEVQAKWNPYVQPKKGRVALAKDSLGVLLAAWRKKVADEKAAVAERARKEAEQLAAQAQVEIRGSSGNLEARERAEETLALAKEADRYAKRREKAATTGTGLRTSYVAVLIDQEAALDWAFGWDGAAFEALATELAQTAVRAGVRPLPGFRIDEVKSAT